MKLLPFFMLIQLFTAAQGVHNKAGRSSSVIEKEIDGLFDKWNHSETPGATVAIVKDGRMVFSKGYGQANLEYNSANKPSTSFHIASLSKQFTAYCILLLEKEGKISLEDEIGKYLPEMQPAVRSVKIKQLLNHTSGIREWIYLMGLSGWGLNDLFTQEEILKLLSQQKELNFDPGSQFMYINSGYTLLGEIVSRVSGKSFSEFTNQYIFRPLGMADTKVLADHEEIIMHRAYSYSFEGGNSYKKKTLNLANVIGSTGVMSTAEDLSKWVAHLEEPTIGNREMIQKMSTKSILVTGDSTSYGMGQFIGSYRGLRTIEHGGSDAGFRTHLLRFPDQRLSIIVLGNVASLNANELAYKIADFYLGAEKPKRTNGVVVTKNSEEKFAKIDLEILKKYEGKFELQPGLIMDFKVQGDNLTVNVTGQGKFTLLAISQSSFTIPGPGANIKFKDGEGEVNELDFQINERQM
ncbi:serine hydrolase domain-containing protein, partial [Flavitalea sp.]|nr:serine hydrolase domain-containing protein [Flavitalea sp.]